MPGFQNLAGLHLRVPLRFGLVVRTLACKSILEFANRFAHRARGFWQPIGTEEQNGYQRNEHEIQRFGSKHFCLLLHSSGSRASKPSFISPQCSEIQ